MSALNTDAEDYRALRLSELREISQDKVTDRKEIGRITNYYGGLIVAKIGDSFGWLIENWDTEHDEAGSYELIPKYLYDALLKFESERKK